MDDPRKTDEKLPQDVLTGRTLGSYRLQRELGRGGMGVVYEAVHERLGQRAAVKVLFPALGRDPSYRRRFLDEARAAARVQHPGVVRIFDSGEGEDGLLYLCMEILDGSTLWERLSQRRAAQQRFSPAEVLRVARQVAAAMAAVHGEAIVHRDLKPENLFFTPDPELPEGERVKVLDFGVAKFLDGASGRTTDGKVFGTVFYLAPEQCGGTGAVGDRTDVYALGVVLYELLAGRLPFEGSADQVMEQHLFSEAEPLPRVVPGLPEEVAQLIRSMMGKLPQTRPSMGEVAARARALEASLAQLVDAPATAALASTHAAPSPPRAERPEDLLGRSIGRYRLVRELGRGGMGAVFEAEHESIGGRAAVKVLLPHLSQEPEFIERFFYEARVVNLVRSEGLVKIYDHGELPDGTLFIQMEFLEGHSLQRELDEARGRGERLPLSQSLNIAAQVAATLAAVHERGIVHRDLKPGNLQLLQDPLLPGGLRVKLVDFGIAKVQRQEEAASGPLTTGGRILGAPLYMSPEQCHQRAAVDGKADVYSLGVILYELLSGQPPFRAQSPATLLGMHMFKQPPPLSEHAPEVPQELAALVERMLRKEPAERPTAGEVAAALSPMAPAPRPPALLAPQPPAPDRSPEPTAPTALAAPERPDPGASPRPRPRRRWAWLLPVGLAVVLPAAPRVLRSLRRAPDAPSAMVRFPTSTFVMGSPEDEREAAFAYCQRTVGDECTREFYEREGPPRQVQISAFALDATEVTHGQYVAWLNRQHLQVIDGRHVKDGGSELIDLYPALGYSGIVHRDGQFHVRDGYGSKPVAQVTWEGAKRYCQGQGKRLPTEAEWELAGRGVHGRRYPWGDAEPTCNKAAFGRLREQACGRDGYGPVEVGTTPADRTPEGILDLGGNVSEWVMDVLRVPYPTCPAPCKDPVEMGDGSPEEVRAARGGSWSFPGESCRLAGRIRRPGNKPAATIGFRCARSLSSAAP